MRYLLIIFALLVSVPAMAEFQGTLGVGNYTTCSSAINRVEQKEDLIVLYGDGEPSLTAGGLHNMATQTSGFLAWRVPPGKNFRMFCTEIVSFAASTITLTLGYADDPLGSSSGSNPVNGVVWLTGSESFDVVQTTAAIGTTQRLINGLAPANSFPFTRLDNGAGDNGAIYVYGILEDE